MPVSVLSAAGPVICDITSYQAPVIALANFSPSGFFKMSVRTTRRSKISPGIWDELKTIFASFALAICDTIGFHVTTTCLEGLVRNADAISESEVFKYFIFLIELSR